MMMVVLFAEKETKLMAARGKSRRAPAKSSSGLLRREPFVKRCHSSPVFEGARANREIEEFLEAADVQRSAAADPSFGKFWAYILDSGRDSDGGYYSAQKFDSTLETIVSAHVRFKHDAISHVMTSIVKGLLALDRTGHRPHGNLKLTNILVSGRGDLPRCRIALTDPAPSSRVTGMSESDDLATLGRLLGQLLEHSGGGSRGKARSEWFENQLAEWRRIEQWLSGHDNARGAPTLQRLLETMPKSRRRLPQWAIPSAVAVLVALVAVGGIISHSYWAQYRRDWEKLCAVYNYWVKPLEKNEGWRKNEQLNVIARLWNDPEQLSDRDPNNISIRGGGRWKRSELYSHPPISWAAMKQTSAALRWLDADRINAELRNRTQLDELAEILQKQSKESLSGENLQEVYITYMRGLLKRLPAPPNLAQDWEKVVDQLKASAERLQTLGLGLSANYLRSKLKEGQSAESDTERTGHIKAANDAIVAAQSIDEAWRNVRRLLDSFPPTNPRDPFLSKLIEWASSSGEDQTGTIDKIEQLREIKSNLTNRAAVLERAKNFISGDEWAKVHRKALSESPAVDPLLKKSNFGQGDVDAWIDAARHHLVSDVLKLAVNASHEQLQKTRNDLNNLKSQNSPQLATLQGDFNKIDADLKAIAEIDTWERLNTSGLDVVALRARLSDLEGKIAEEIKPNPEQLTTIEQRLKAPIGKTAEINGIWEALRGQVLKLQAPQTTLEARSRIQKLETIVARLTKADGITSTLPELSRLSLSTGSTSFREIASSKSTKLQNKAMANMVQILKSITWDAQPSQSELEQRLDGLTRDLVTQRQAWENALNQLAQIQERIDQGEAWDSVSDVIKDWNGNPQIAELRGEKNENIQLIDALAQTDKKPVSQLPAIANDVTSPSAIRLAAYRQLLKSKDWPSKPQELAQSANVLIPMHSDATGTGRTVLAKNVSDISAAIWRQFVEHSTTNDMFREAANRREMISGEPSQFLSVNALANLRLYEVVQAVDAKDSQTTKDAVSRLSEQAAVVQQAPNLAQFTELVNKLKETQGQQGGGDLTKAGPGLFDGTVTRPSADQSVVTYTLKLGARPKNFDLTFCRVQPNGGKNAYLCTTEIWVGLFAALCSKPNSPLKALLADPSAGVSDWQLSDRNLERSYKWSIFARVPGTKVGPDLDKAFQDQSVPKPGDEYPMHYLSPQAAAFAARLLGCRLPTAGEWQAACAPAPEQISNLRDQKFADLGNAIKQSVRFIDLSRCWLDLGTFEMLDTDLALKPDDHWNPRPAPIPKDSYALFAPVAPNPNESPKEFQHLIGNVAEFIFDDPTRWDSLFASEPDPKATSKMIGDNFGKLRVIGGSALSWRTKDNEPLSVQHPERASAGYSDVGFRLAFTAPGKEYWRLVKDTIGESPTYLKAE